MTFRKSSRTPSGSSPGNRAQLASMVKQLLYHHCHRQLGFRPRYSSTERPIRPQSAAISTTALTRTANAPRACLKRSTSTPYLDTLDVDQLDMIEYLPGLLRALRVRHVRLTRKMLPENRWVPDDPVPHCIEPGFITALDAVLACPTVRTCTFFDTSYEVFPEIDCSYRLCRTSSIPPLAISAFVEPPEGYKEALCADPDEGIPSPNIWRFHNVRPTLTPTGAVVLPASHRPYCPTADDWVLLLIVEPRIPSELIWTMGVFSLVRRFWEEENPDIPVAPELLKK